MSYHATDTVPSMMRLCADTTLRTYPSRCFQTCQYRESTTRYLQTLLLLPPPRLLLLPLLPRPLERLLLVQSGPSGSRCPLTWSWSWRHPAPPHRNPSRWSRPPRRSTLPSHRPCSAGLLRRAHWQCHSRLGSHPPHQQTSPALQRRHLRCHLRHLLRCHLRQPATAARRRLCTESGRSGARSVPPPRRRMLLCDCAPLALPTSRRDPPMAHRTQQQPPPAQPRALLRSEIPSPLPPPLGL